jgi:hypothetical protein
MVDAVSNVSTTTPYNYGYSDYGDYDYDYSMNGSIFGGGYMTPYGGTYNNQQYFDNMKQNQQFWVDYNVDQQNMNRNADLRINASVEGVKVAAAILKDKVLANEQDQIQGAFNNYVEAVRAAYGDGTDSEIKSRALSLYAQMNGGMTLYQDLRENSHSSFTQGLIHTMTFGLYDKNSAEDNISAISGAPVGSGEKVAQNFGRITGVAAVGGAGYGIAKALSGSAKVASTKAGSGVVKACSKAGKVGLAVAGIAALISFITGKVTT